MSRIDEIAAEVKIIKNNHLAHLQDDVSELKARTLLIETKISLVEQYLGKALKWILPAAIIISAMVQSLMTSV